jgi:hypothetical protein
MLCLALALSLLLGHHPVQGRETIYRQVVEKPDINNGYEDYLRAADMVTHHARLGVFMSWTPKQYQELLADKQTRADAKKEDDWAWSDVDELRLSIAREVKDADHLSVQRLITKEFTAPLDRIRIGNQKRVWNPREKVDLVTLFPELAQFKSLAKMFRADAYVRLADGESSIATNNLLDGLTFARRIGGQSLISDLVSIACTAIVLAAFDEHLDRFTAKDARKIAAYCEAALSEPLTFIQSMRQERESTVAMVDEIFNSPETARAFLSFDEDESSQRLEKYVKDMSASERGSVKALFKRKVSEIFGAFEARLGKDESTWLAAMDSQLPPEPTTVANAEDCVDALLNVITPFYPQAIVSVLKSRAQLRLLGLHARIIEFKWQTTKLPTSLAETASAEQRLDPLTKTEFRYELLEGAYKLYSNGLATTGPIELRYRRPGNLPIDNSDPIPPLFPAFSPRPQ